MRAGRGTSAGRVSRWGRGFLFGLCLAALLAHCGRVVEQEPTPLPVAPADRESWQVELEIGEGERRIGIEAAYALDFVERQTTLADSGVQVVFRDAEGRVHSQLEARRLSLAHGERHIGLGGQIHLRAGKLELRADSLVWDGERELLRVPGALEVRAESGRERGRDLETGPEVEMWTMVAVEGLWQGEGYEVEVRAARARGQRRDGFLSISYDSAAVRRGGVEVRSGRAHYNQEQGAVYFVGGVQGADSARTFSAGQAEFQLGEERLAARAGVVLQEGEVELRADEAVDQRREGRLEVRGAPATFAQGDRQIEAGHLQYWRGEEVLEAAEQPRYRQGERYLEAGHLHYGRRAERLRADGGVLLRTPEFAGEVRGRSLLLDLGQERGALSGDPLLSRPRRDGGALEVRADSFAFDLGERQLRGVGNFRLEEEGVRLGAARGLYLAGEERLLAAGAVVLEQEEAGAGRQSRVLADSMVAHLEGGQVSRVEVPSPVRARIEAAERVNWVEGERGHFFLQSGRLQRVEIEGRADVTHRHLGRGEISRFRGQRLELEFGEAGLERARVEGGAELVSRLPPEAEGEQAALNQVRGEELEIFFQDGSIARVSVGPQVEGKYFPNPEEERGAQD